MLVFAFRHHMTTWRRVRLFRNQGDTDAEEPYQVVRFRILSPTNPRAGPAGAAGAATPSTGSGPAASSRGSAAPSATAVANLLKEAFTLRSERLANAPAETGSEPVPEAKSSTANKEAQSSAEAKADSAVSGSLSVLCQAVGLVRLYSRCLTHA